MMMKRARILCLIAILLAVFSALVVYAMRENRHKKYTRAVMVINQLTLLGGNYEK